MSKLRKMGLTNDLQIGDWVEVCAEAYAETQRYGAEAHQCRRIRLDRLTTPRVGRVVGVARLQEGKYRSNGPECEGVIVQRKYTAFWLVRYSWLEMAVYVPDDHIHRTTPPAEGFPVMTVTESQREDSRALANDMLRGPHGEFVHETATDWQERHGIGDHDGSWV